MATFLELCQDVARESGTVSGSQPSSVAGQTGRLAKVVNWTAQAWTLIQNRRNGWRWMRKEFTGDTIASTARYTAASFNITDLARWHVDNAATGELPVSIYRQSTGAADEGSIVYVSWPVWRARYGRGAQVTNRPVEYTISPSGELCLGPVPDDAYVINGEYWKTPQVLSANADVPECPERFHDIIVYRALMLLAGHDEASTTYAEAMANYTQMLADLERDQFEQVSLGGGPLA
jgi:hypothetical protein